MEFFHGIVALLAFGLLVLSGLVTWLYVQQTRLLSAVNSLAIAISTPPPVFTTPPPSAEPVIVHKMEEDGEETTPEEEDDRVSVYEEESVASTVENEEEPEVKQEEVADAPHGDEDVDYSKKTIAELRDLLTTKGIPYNKSDKKSVLLSLLRATA